MRMGAAHYARPPRTEPLGAVGTMLRAMRDGRYPSAACNGGRCDTLLCVPLPSTEAMHSALGGATGPTTQTNPASHP